MSARWLASAVVLAAVGAAGASPLRIVGPQGEPAGDATVKVLVRPATASFVEQLAGPVSSGKTDATGAIELALPAIDRDLFLFVDHPAFLPLWAPLSELRESRAVLAPAVRRGRVSAPPGGALEGTACARWRRTLPVVMHEMSFERCAALQASGDFAIPGVEPDAAGTLIVEAKGYLPLTRPLDDSGPLALTPGVEIAGVVTSTAGRPLPGVRVKSGGGLAVETDARGRFVMRCSLPEKLELRSPGFRSREWALAAAPATPLVIDLAPGPTLQGKVTTGTGDALPELALQLVRHHEGGQRVERVVTEVEKEGTFLLDLPGAGPFTLRFRAPAYRTYESPRFTAKGAERVDLGVIRLSAGSGVTGRIVDGRSGAALPGALVLLLPQGRAGFYRLTRQPTARAVTGEDGRYRIVGQAEGSYELRVRRDGFATVSEELALDDEVVVAKDLHLGRGAEVHGQVSSRSGRPRPGLSVRFASRGGSSLVPLAEVTTGDDGRFRGVHLGGGDYRVEVVADSVLLTQEVVVPDDEETVELPLTIPGTALHGQVLRDGAPAAGGSLRIAPVGQTEPRTGKLILEVPSGTEIIGPPDAWQDTVVASNGRFFLADAPTGAVSFLYTSPAGGSWRWRREVLAREEAHVTLACESGRLHGRAVDARSGEPVTDAMASAWDADGTLSGQATSDDAGEFVIDGLADGAYRLEIAREGYRRAVVRAAAAGDASGRLVEVRLEPGDQAAIAIHLTRASGEPFAFGFVSLISGAGQLVRSLSLDETGERELRDLLPGVYRLAWSDPSVGAGAYEPVVLEGGKETSFARRLETPGRIELRCADEGCAQSSIENLGLLTPNGFDLASLLPGFSPRLRLSSAGRVTLGAVQPGRYLLRWRTGGSVFQQPLTVRSGETALASISGGR